MLSQKRNGFFVECGAVDGVFLSNTLFFELQRSWTGLLIEPNPKYFQQILHTNRNAYASKSCLSTGNSTQEVTFQPLETWGGVVGEMTDPHVDMLHKLPFYKTTNNITAQCFTLYSLLLAIGQTEVDYFSLDVEGPELKILQTIPFDKVKIDMISIEYSVMSHGSVVNEKLTLEKLQQIREFFGSLGTYKEVGILPWGQHGNVHKVESRGIDVIFKRI